MNFLDLIPLALSGPFVGSRQPLLDRVMFFSAEAAEAKAVAWTTPGPALRTQGGRADHLRSARLFSAAPQFITGGLPDSGREGKQGGTDLVEAVGDSVRQRKRQPCRGGDALNKRGLFSARYLPDTAQNSNQENPRA